MNNLKRQRGLSFSGFMLGAFVLVMVSMLGLKLIPSYMQNGAITKIFTAIASDPDMQKAPVREIRASFARRASIDNITAITAEDIQMESDSGRLVLSASYTVKVPLVANVSLSIDFKPSSAAK
jgi:hypothetical protein